MSAYQPILIVDDDREIRYTLCHILVAEGYEVLCAADGAEALALIDQCAPSLIVLDIRMPVLDGRGVAQALAARAAAPPILVMTASQDAWRWAGEISAAGVIDKPFEINEMLSLIGRVLARPRAS
jgi:two-component system response regulator MprA